MLLPGDVRNIGLDVTHIFPTGNFLRACDSLENGKFAGGYFLYQLHQVPVALVD